MVTFIPEVTNEAQKTLNTEIKQNFVHNIIFKLVDFNRILIFLFNAKIKHSITRLK